MMKKNITTITIIGLLIVLLSPTIVLAVNDMQLLLNQAAGSAGAGYDTSADLADTGIARILGTIVRFVVSFVGIIFITYIIYGGYLWMTASGNEEKTTKAKKIIRDGIIGLILILSAVGIYLLVREFFIISGSGSAATGS